MGVLLLHRGLTIIGLHLRALNVPNLAVVLVLPVLDLVVLTVVGWIILNKIVLSYKVIIRQEALPEIINLVFIVVVITTGRLIVHLWNLEIPKVLIQDSNQGYIMITANLHIMELRLCKCFQN